MNQISGNAAAGSLDPSFGTGGVVALPNGARSIALLPNNKLIVLTGASLQEPITVAQLTEAGALDPSFGDGGMVEVSVTGYRMLVSHILVLRNGNYLIAGYESGTASTRKYVCQLLKNGQLDETFGEGGLATIRVPDIDAGQGVRFVSSPEQKLTTDAVYFAGEQIAVSEQNAKIYFCAHVHSEARGFEGVLFRLNSDGSSDTGFNDRGYVVISPDGGSSIRLTSLTAQGDGVLVSGGFRGTTGSREVAFLKRYDQRGNIDSSFGVGGTVLIPNGIDGRTSIINSVELNDSGLIVASGESGKTGEKEGLLTVLNPNGGFNLIFNQGQPLYADFLPNLFFSTSVFQHSGKIIVSGSGGDGYVVAARYDFFGDLDPTFGGKGWVVHDSIVALGVESSELTADNKIVVLGNRSLQKSAVRYLG
ncbi:hypothetical protein [Pseudomonas frederiksbergensis]|uniref:Delta-60 repeat domain-containing protein n=1 Tax=Pseudomonas frederiksbergensis TaxID=104087 RepID=A0A423HX57_9PSED|nr:hypothetical protein [Pseudomonas frederiksbergensis]RON17767.1 hypothetical protein BK662_06255 [Pseudomonas frederiksbergensis]